MRRRLIFFAAFVVAEMLGPIFTTANGDANAPKPVQLSQDPHFRMLIENTRVRVWIMELRPNEKTNLVSRSYDFLQIPLDEGWMSTSIEGRQAIPFWVEKKARFVHGGFAQIVQNTHKASVQTVEIEFIKSINVERCGPEAQVSCGCFGGVGGITSAIGCEVLDTDDVTIKQLETHAAEQISLLVVPTLVVSIDPLKIQGDVGLILKPGEVLWVDKPERTIESPDQRTTSKAVTLEFKHRSSDLSAR